MPKSRARLPAGGGMDRCRKAWGRGRLAGGRAVLACPRGRDRVALLVPMRPVRRRVWAGCDCGLTGPCRARDWMNSCGVFSTSYAGGEYHRIGARGPT